MSRYAATLSPLLGIMTVAARKAALGVLRDFREVSQLQVSKKGPADFVTSADKRADEVLREELSRTRPDYGFLTEEGEAIEGTDSEHCWIIDPIDGTLNFLHSLPSFAISVALTYRDDVVCGVTYDPVLDEIFYAEKGKGAYLNDKRMRVSARVSMEEALIAAASSGFARPERERYFREADAVSSKAAGLRSSGCASLNLAYVAAGRFDGYWERHLQAWDIAAGIVLLREAGGIVSEPDGGDKMLESGAILAANPGLHRLLAGVLRETRT